MKTIPTRTSVHDALDRMDALLDPSLGMLNVPPGSATAKACQRDMAAIRAAVNSNTAGVTEANVRLEMEHVLHTLDGGRMMEMDGDRIVATVMGLVQRASLAAGPSSPWQNDRCEHGVCDEEDEYDRRCTAWQNAYRLTNEPVTTQGRVEYWIQELRGKARTCRAVASAIDADPSVQIGTPQEVAGGINQDADAFDAAATLIEDLAAGLAAPAGEPPPFTGYWRGGNGVISCGTLRIFSENFDTNPANDVKAVIVKWVCDTLNAAQQPSVVVGHDASSDADVPCVPATVPAPFHPPLHLVSHIASLIAADLLGQSKEEDRQLVALRLVELLVRANAHPCCPPPADRTEVQERQQLGCAHCGTGIYCVAPRHQ